MSHLYVAYSSKQQETLERKFASSCEAWIRKRFGEAEWNLNFSVNFNIASAEDDADSNASYQNKQLVVTTNESTHSRLWRLLTGNIENVSYSAASDQLYILKRVLADLGESLSAQQKANNDISFAVYDDRLQMASGWAEMVISMDSNPLITIYVGPQILCQWLDIQFNSQTNVQLKDRKPAISHAKVEMIAILGTAKVSANELYALSVGDVLQLNESIQDDVIILNSEQKKVGNGILGAQSGSKAIFLK